MNVGIVTTWFERGAAYVSKQYMESLQPEHNVYIYARGGEEYPKTDDKWNLKNVHWGKKDIFQLNNTPINKSDFESWIIRNKIEIILFNEQQWWPPVIWAKELGIKIGSYIDYYTERTVPLFEIFDFLICNTLRHYSVFNWHSQCYYVPWGTDVDLFKMGNKREEDNQKVIFFNSSGYNPDRKGVYPLIRAFYKIKAENKKLILHSQVDLKKYYKDIAYMVEELLNKKELEIINETVTAPGLYHLADVYCYISKLDGLGLTLSEALSCGLPSIVPDNAPMNEFVKENSNGKLVRLTKLYCRQDAYYWPQCEVDENSLQEAMEYYIEKKEELNQIKLKTREKAIKNLNWKDRKGDIIRIFEQSEKLELDLALKKKILKYEISVKKIKDFFPLVYRFYKSIRKGG